MRALLFVLGCAAAAAGEVRAPLGPYARPGVPVLLTSAGAEVVRIDGWSFLVDGVALVHPPRVPAVVRDGDARDLMHLQAPGDALLVGVLGDAPTDLAARLSAASGRSVRVIPLRLEGLSQARWRALDLFDRIVVTREAPGWREVLETWKKAGGSVVAGLAAAIAPVEPLLVPRPAPVRPDLYDLILPPAGARGSLSAARWIVWGAAAAMALQLVLIWRGWIGLRLALVGLCAVGALGVVIGLIRPGADYSAVARGRIEEAIFLAGDVERRRTFLTFSWAGPGAAAPVRETWTPILFRAGGDAWWSEAGGESPLEKGMIRVFLAEEVVLDSRPDAAGSEAASKPPWAAPSADRGEVPLLARTEVIVQD